MEQAKEKKAIDREKSVESKGRENPFSRVLFLRYVDKR